MRDYTVSGSVTVTAAGGDNDLLYIKPAADKPVVLMGWSIGQSTAAQDANEKELRFSLIYLPTTVTVGSGGSSITPRSCDSVMSVAAGYTARMGDPTVATTSGTAQTWEERTWNNRGNPWEWLYPDIKSAPLIRNPDAFVLRLQTTLAADSTFNCTFWTVEV
jgi:hypothetical protein